MRTVVFVQLLFLSILSFGFTVCTRQEVFAGKVPSHQATRFVFSAPAAASKLLKPCSRNGPAVVSSVLWAPSAEQIDELESRFDRCLSHNSLSQLSKYDRQYVGLLRGQSKFIYLSAAAHDPIDSKEQIRHPLDICDGGESYFGVEYDVSKKEFSHLEFNGPSSGNVAIPVTYVCKPGSDLPPQPADECFDIGELQFQFLRRNALGSLPKEHWVKNRKSLSPLSSSLAESAFREACRSRFKAVAERVNFMGRLYAPKSKKSAWITSTREIFFEGFSTRVDRKRVGEVVEELYQMNELEL